MPGTASPATVRVGAGFSLGGRTPNTCRGVQGLIADSFCRREAEEDRCVVFDEHLVVVAGLRGKCHGEPSTVIAPGYPQPCSRRQLGAVDEVSDDAGGSHGHGEHSAAVIRAGLRLRRPSTHHALARGWAVKPTSLNICPPPSRGTTTRTGGSLPCGHSGIVAAWRMRRVRPGGAAIAAAGTVVLRASAFPVMSVSVAGLGPVGLSVARLVVASLALGVAAPWMGLRRPRPRDFPLIALCRGQLHDRLHEPLSSSARCSLS